MKNSLTTQLGLHCLSIAAAGCNQQEAPSAAKNSTPVAAVVAIAQNDCRALIDVTPGAPWEFREVGSNAKPVTVTVKNNGSARWGGPTDLHLGVVWFEGKKTDSNHAPNLGEQWWPLPGPLGPGESLKFDVSVNVPNTAGDYSAWFSMLQPGVMWCFHTGDPATKLAVTVKR